MLSLTACLKKYPDLQPIDYFVARDISRQYPMRSSADSDVFFHVLLALSYALRNGHSCLDLRFVAEAHWWQRESDNDNPGYTFPDYKSIGALLGSLPISKNDDALIVFDAPRLYLRRYWQFEMALAGQIQQRLQCESANVEIDKAQDVLQTLFPPNSQQNDIDWQQVAVANALDKSLSIIVGGPGTGKTTTVTKLLVALVALAEHAPHITLAAPTGKAAQRLSESIMGAKARLQSSLSKQWLDAIPAEASTLHRLLGVIPNSYEYRHHQGNPLMLDVLVVDEVSMVDLPMMVRLFRALPPQARVIMLGDSDQLPSVAAGSVLADLAPFAYTAFSNENIQAINQRMPLELSPSAEPLDYCTRLTVSHRFASGGGIGLLAQAIIQGEAAASWNALSDSPDSLALCSPEQTVEDWLKPLVKRYYAPIFRCERVEDAFAQLEQFRILAAMRVGEQGVESLNLLVESRLRELGLMHGDHTFYHGRPIMVTENHYGLGLFNGDTGLVWRYQGRLMAAFPTPEGTRWLLTARLPKVMTVYAMTIHKTQGSEFGHVALVLPDNDHDLLTRELIYTGVTRAKQQCSVWSSELVWRAAVERRVERWSGLREALVGS
jgi:exodeoxyribonuclease V alpha subunit